MIDREVSGDFLVADRLRVDATLDAMAARIHARLGSEVALVGIRRRGVPLAEELGRRLARVSGSSPAIGEIELSRYSDDLSLLHDRPLAGQVELPRGIENGTVVLVDDVLYTGRTLIRAIDVLLGQRARRVAIAVLCSRGSTEVPIEAEFVGMRFDLGDRDLMEVQIPPYEPELRIVLRHRPVG